MSTTVANNASNVWGGGNKPMNASYGKLMMWFFLMSDAFTFGAFLTAYGVARHRWPTWDVLSEQLGLTDFVTSTKWWPIPEEIFNAAPFFHGSDLPLLFVAFMTMVLILSSVTMVLAVEAGQRMDKKQVQMWLLCTIVGGSIFLGSQAWEWGHFITGTDKGYVTYTEEGIEKRAWLVENVPHEADLTAVEGLKLEINRGTTSSEILEGAKAHKLVESSISGRFNGANLKENEYGPTLFANLFFFITGFHGTHVFSGVILLILAFYQTAFGVYERRGHYEMVEKIGLYWHFVDLVWVFVFTFFYLL